MNLYIDNNDGQGGVDYTNAVMPSRPLTIVRARGEWARCSASLDIVGSGLPMPQSRARVLVTDATSAILFQGYLAWNSTATALEAAVATAEEAPVFTAFESAWLTAESPVAELVPPTATTHQVELSNVNLSFAESLSSASVDCATDVTVSGADGTSAYVTELFQGDGTTATFLLAHPPFRPSGSDVLVNELFDESTLNAATWTLVDAGKYLTLGSGGLRMEGGGGVDGTTVLQKADSVELGGTLLAEASGVTLDVGSDGILLGFYDGGVSQDRCVAGIRVVGTGGASTLFALVDGTEQATSYTFAAGHLYTLRVRLHCPESIRLSQTYTAAIDGTVKQFTSPTIGAPISVVIEVLDTGLASSTLPTVLYDGNLASSPAIALFALVNSRSITGSVAATQLLQQGSGWVTKTSPDGTVVTQREGSLGTGADFTLSTTGSLTFASGRVPQPGDLLRVRYRRSQRSVARFKDPASDQARVSLALPGLPAWIGHVVSPPARSSADCLAAAQALVALATGSATGKSGRVTWTRGPDLQADVRPSDTLSVVGASATHNLSLQTVTLTARNCVPELFDYSATFAQNRASSTDFSVAKTIARDAVQPVNFSLDETELPSNLAGLQVISATASALTVDAGVDPVTGGGFEVRRSEANFGSPDISDLVLTSPVRGFSIPRLAFTERFFVRMYDASATPSYSPLSSLVITNLPNAE